MTAEAPYSATELLACVAARLLEDRKSVFVGTGLPMIAAMLAQRTHAPGLLIIFEAGGIGPHIPVLPISVGDSRTFHQAVAASSMHDVMSMAQAGRLDFGFLGAAQIDPYGNINTTVIGEHDHPTARLPGSGRRERRRLLLPSHNNHYAPGSPQVHRAARLPDHARVLTGPGARNARACRQTPARIA